MQEILVKYLDYCKTERLMKPRSLNDYRTAVRFLCDEIDPLSATEFSQVNDAIKKIRESRGWSPATTSKNAKCIKNFYAWLTREKIIEHNPFPFHEFKRPRPKEPEYITEKQFENLLCDYQLSHQEKTIMLLLWDCAPRVSELCTLTQQEVNFEDGYIHIPREKSKGEYSDRFVPFTQRTSDALKTQIELVRKYGHHEHIFINSWWECLDARGVSEMLTKIGLRRTPFREAIRLTPHMFRHSFGMRMIPLVGEIIVSKWLGHNSLSSTHQYSHMDRTTSLEIFKKQVVKSA